MIIDNEFKELIPNLSESEFGQLEKNILAEGIRDKLIIWKGVLIDGHNRYKIAQNHNLNFETIEKEFEIRDDVKNWIIDNQLGRRNITAMQRDYLLGLRYKQEKKQHGGDRKSEVSSPQNDDLKKTSEIIAKQQGVSKATVERAEKVADGIDNISKFKPELKQEILQGKSEYTKKDVSSFSNIDVEAEVEKRLKEIELEKENKKKAKQKQIEKAKVKILEQTKKSIKIKPEITNIMAKEYLKNIENVDLLITDPPYSTDIENLDEFILEWYYEALNKVKDTGRAYIFIGAYPEELKSYLNAKKPEHLKLEQILIWSYKNTLGNNPKDRYKLNYQSCLYLKGVNAPNLNIDLTSEQWAVQEINAPDGRQGDRYHKWQKPIELSDRFIRHSTKENDVVLDLFACTGTFLLSAAKLGRKAIGCDISLDNLKIAEERGCTIITK